MMGLYANIAAKKKPTADAFKQAAKTAKKK
jgi:hypothetical protein